MTQFNDPWKTNREGTHLWKTFNVSCREKNSRRGGGWKIRLIMFCVFISDFGLSFPQACKSILLWNSMLIGVLVLLSESCLPAPAHLVPMNSRQASAEAWWRAHHLDQVCWSRAGKRCLKDWQPAWGLCLPLLVDRPTCSFNYSTVVQKMFRNTMNQWSILKCIHCVYLYYSEEVNNCSFQTPVWNQYLTGWLILCLFYLTPHCP